MNFKYIHIIVVLMICLLSAPALLQAQGNSQHAKEVHALFESFKNFSTYSYQYHMTMIFPDSTSETMSGKVYYDQTGKVMFQDNKAFTVLYNGKWFYKADHLEKAISIINVTKYLNGKADELEIDEVFKGQLTDEYIDSFILKSGMVKSFKEEGNIQDVSIGFSKPSGSLRSIDVSYDVKKRIPIKLKMITYYPYQQEGSGYTQIITCNRYSTAKQYKEMNTYFSSEAGKVILKQYQDYKLNSLL